MRETLVAHRWAIVLAKRTQTVGFLMLIPLVAWAIVGAVWVFGPHADECDHTILKSAQTSVGVFLVLAAFNLAMAPRAYYFLQKRWVQQSIQLQERASIIKPEMTPRR